jgi:NAD(P)-dependent dehydrogenase (short-subunit alcohol dehydrogenase family)
MIHIVSDAGIWGEQATGLYSMTKAAVAMLGTMLALDAGPDGLRWNVLCPGDIWPGMRHMARPASRTAAKTRVTGRSRPPAGWARPAIRPGSSPGPPCWRTAE